MSTIIIVLLVIVLVVAIVLKKRENTQNHAASKKSASKTAKKAATRTALAREERESAPPATTAISESLRQKLTQQIQSGNYQSAEAQINQALKQDNSQHELYLFLLDIHLAQKDDFAIDQLIKHVHALKLADIAQAAEAKNQERIKNSQSFDSIDFKSHSTPSFVETAEIPNKTADFDALVQTSAKPTFEDIQSEYTAPAEQEKPVEAAAQVQALDFDFSFEQKETVKPTTELQQQPTLDFSSASAPATEALSGNDAKPELDFNFSNLDATSSQSEIKNDNITETSGLDFNIDQPQHHSEKQAATEKTEFSFDLAEPTTATEPSLEVAEPIPQTPTVELNDPLAQSFPDLQQLDEAQLNLDLAEQYIELGAYASARELLQNHQLQLNQEQQQRSEKLLNKIAS
ncbi:FimV domain-containing protein [Acinetobacter sp. NIPH 1852]|uniref:FimV domain-containing protein n=1 Tax=Acinetobacter sp. NIPH 1852 TaxID=2923428 RepID=UPI001F4B5D67|nr:FimV domain-containing protein [Acinetobacter sp. NIPH 1852]MCH7308260.1 FimV domain-containing protein [Acinetobacter sp. NIPH 1852]